MAKSRLDKTEVSKAQIGPRELKDPHSKEYAIQTVYALKTYVQSKVADEQLIEKELGKIRKYRHWEVLGYSDEDELLLAEIGMDQAKLKAWAKTIREQGAGPRSGEIGRGDRGYQITPNADRGASSTYLARRLLRDNPEIFERLEAGEFSSVRAAALEAGIVKPTFTCPLEPRRAARLIAKHFSGEQLTQLIEFLVALEAEA